MQVLEQQNIPKVIDFVPNINSLDLDQIRRGIPVASKEFKVEVTMGKQNNLNTKKPYLWKLLSKENGQEFELEAFGWSTNPVSGWRAANRKHKELAKE